MDAQEILYPVTDAFNSAAWRMVSLMGQTALVIVIGLLVIYAVWVWSERL